MRWDNSFIIMFFDVICPLHASSHRQIALAQPRGCERVWRGIKLPRNHGRGRCSDFDNSYHWRALQAEVREKACQCQCLPEGYRGILGEPDLRHQKVVDRAVLHSPAPQQSMLRAAQTAVTQTNRTHGFLFVAR